MTIDYYCPAQLGVVNQKRPVVWQSSTILQVPQDDIARISFAGVDAHKLITIAYNGYADDGVGVSLSIGDHKLISTIYTAYITDSVGVSLSIGGHELNKVAYGNNIEDDVGLVNLAIGDHKLYIWGISSEVLDEDNFKVSLAVGDHKLYEEKS